MSRKGRKSGGRRNYGRRAAGAVRRGGNKVLRAFGINKGSINVGKTVMGLSVVVPAFIPSAFDGTTYQSPIGCLTGAGGFSGDSFVTRMQRGLACYTWNTIGYRLPMVGFLGSNTSAPTGLATTARGLGGMALLGGAGLTLAGKFINPMLAGSAVKL